MSASGLSVHIDREKRQKDAIPDRRRDIDMTLNLPAAKTERLCCRDANIAGSEAQNEPNNEVCEKNIITRGNCEHRTDAVVATPERRVQSSTVFPANHADARRPARVDVLRRVLDETTGVKFARTGAGLGTTPRKRPGHQESQQPGASSTTRMSSRRSRFCPEARSAQLIDRCRGMGNSAQRDGAPRKRAGTSIFAP